VAGGQGVFLVAGLQSSGAGWLKALAGLVSALFRSGRAAIWWLINDRQPRTNDGQHAAAPNFFSFLCGIERRTDANRLGCLCLCTVFFHSLTFFFSLYLLPRQVLRPNLTRETRKLLGPRLTVCNGQFLKTDERDFSVQPLHFL
jgi:hypothetical protein